MTYGERTCQVRGPSSGESCALCTTDGGCDSGPVKFRDLAVGCAGGGGCGRRSRCFKRPPARWLRRRSVVARRSGLKALRVAFFFSVSIFPLLLPGRRERDKMPRGRQTLFCGIRLRGNLIVISPTRERSCSGPYRKNRGRLSLVMSTYPKNPIQ